MSIHETAIISPEAEIASDVVVGPYAVIRGKVRIGEGSIIENGATVGTEFGSVEMGKNNRIMTGSVVGGPPQDLKYDDENTQLIIGDGNIIREFCTLNLGTVTGTGKTVIGSNNLLMAYVHIAHDCRVANNVVIANSTHFAGHVEVDDYARIGGMCGITQFVRLGKYCYISGDTSINKDILPFSMAKGNFATIRATNKVGLERSGFSKDEVTNIHKAIRTIIKGDRTIEEALSDIGEKCTQDEHIQCIVDFVKSSQLGVAR